MESIAQFFAKLLDTSDWPPRWYCGEWSDFHGWLYIGSDVVIWLAYFVIPVILLWFMQRRPDLPFLPVFWLFSAFILLCGATHVLDAIIFWWPGYRLSALIRFFTAVVSMATVFALARDVPKALMAWPSGSPKKNSIPSDNLVDTEYLVEQIEVRDRKIEELKVELDNLRKTN